MGSKPIRTHPPQEKSGASLTIKIIIKWPASRFAVNRTVSVNGRITFLVNSIRTIKGCNTRGVPFGRKWARVKIGCFVSVYIIIDNHIGSARVVANTGWVEGV